MKSKSLVILFLAIFILSFSSISSLASDIDIAAWNKCETLYPVLNGESHSNSAVQRIFVRSEYDYPSNRVRLLFMAEMDSFAEDESKTGISLVLNNGEKIILHLNGDSEYNTDIYFAEVLSYSDPLTKTLYLEVTLGVKDGLPENLVLDFQIYDTFGIASNVYTLDITEQAETTASTTTTKATQKSNRNNNNKTKTQKSSKAKSTKATTATKEAADKIDSSPETTIRNNSTTHENFADGNVKSVGIIIAVAAALVGIGSCAIRIFKRSKK